MEPMLLTENREYEEKSSEQDPVGQRVSVRFVESVLPLPHRGPLNVRRLTPWCLLSFCVSSSRSSGLCGQTSNVECLPHRTTLQRGLITIAMMIWQSIASCLNVLGFWKVRRGGSSQVSRGAKELANRSRPSFRECTLPCRKHCQLQGKANDRAHMRRFGARLRCRVCWVCGRRIANRSDVSGRS